MRTKGSYSYIRVNIKRLRRYITGETSIVVSRRWLESIAGERVSLLTYENATRTMNPCKVSHKHKH